jgi:hypothetical protein
MNADLHEGATDGSYKKVIRDRGGRVEAATWDSRRDLLDNWYGIHEKPVKLAGDNVPGPTPNYVSTPAPSPTVPL